MHINLPYRTLDFTDYVEISRHPLAKVMRSLSGRVVTTVWTELKKKKTLTPPPLPPPHKVNDQFTCQAERAIFPTLKWWRGEGWS